MVLKKQKTKHYSLDSIEDTRHQDNNKRSGHSIAR